MLMTRLFYSLPLALVLATGVRSRADETEQIQSLLAKQAPTVVTVKAILKTQMSFGPNTQSFEMHTDIEGVVVSPDGLIMLSDSAWDTDRFKDIMGGGGSSGDEPKMKTTPTGFKVTIAQDNKEYDAFLAATDNILGLAFVKIQDLGDKKLAAVDFSASSAPAVGQKVIGISRLPKGYDYAPFYKSAVVSGEISIPRKAYLLDGAIASIGLPIYTVDGQLLGVLTTLKPSVSEENSENDFGTGFGFLMSLFGGGGSGLVQTFVVPGPAVNTLITQAKQRAVEVAAERAKSQAGKTAASSGGATPAKKPDTGKKP